MLNHSLPVTLDQGLTKYLGKVNGYPILTEEEELGLANRVYQKQDIEAAHALVTSHLKLVVKVALKMKGYGLVLMDLISEGNIGLMHAVKKFNPTLGYRLSTYAMWWIKASINEYIIKSWSLVKIGTTIAQKKLFFNLRKLKNKILTAHNSNILSEEDTKTIASELDVSPIEVKEMDMRLNSGVSLDQEISQDENNSATLLDTLADQRDNQEIIVSNAQDLTHKKQLFSNALNELNDREKNILISRHLQDKPDTLEKLSQKYTVSRERIRQIESRALEKVKKFCLEAAAQPS